MRMRTWNKPLLFVVLLGLSICLLAPAAWSQDSKALLDKYWSDGYGAVPFATVAEDYYMGVVAKAKPDECYYGLGDSLNKASFYQNYPNNLADTNCPGGRPKVNQAYVWGITRAGGNIWFGTVANTLCLVLGGFYPAGTFPPFQTNSWTCEMGQNGNYDIRPPRIFIYNTDTKALIDKTPDVFNSAADKARLLGTYGLRSAGSNKDVVFMGGLGSGGVTMFAFQASTKKFLGSITFDGKDGRPLYTNIRQWKVINSNLYTGVATRGGGQILRWTGSVTNPFSFEVVGDVGGDPAYLTLHQKRIYVSTWGGPAGSGGLVIYMSPLIPDGGSLTTANRSGWTSIWQLSNYEVEPAAVQGGGAIASFDGYLYFGTMHVPGTGLFAFEQLYGTTADAVAFLGTYRPITIFRMKNPGTSTQKVEVLYGSTLLPKYDAVNAKWNLVPNNLKQTPVLGLAGFGNFFNNYTWWMEVQGNKLYVGTMDWLYLITEGANDFGVQIPPRVLEAARNFEGADLWRFGWYGNPADSVNLQGMGNRSSYGIRTMVVDGADLYLGMANPMNLLTEDPLKGGWELIKLNRY